MIARRVKANVLEALDYQSAVAIIGPRQVGKTTLALDIASELGGVYLDLEDSRDISKLAEPRLYLERHENRLVILDEIHRLPGLFKDLRGLIDSGRRKGLRSGRFLILGSAAAGLLRQSGETLAGRIAYIDMGPLNILECGNTMAATVDLWVRGGYPDSLLAASGARSLKLRKDFIRTYLERDVAQFGPQLPPVTLERLWTMLAHSQGGLLNASQFAGGLGVSAQTVTRYIDLLDGLLLVRRLMPLHVNIRKRLIKAPKLYVRDSGLLHALLSISNFDDLAGHPVMGASWEGFVIEHLISVAPDRSLASFYRTATGVEIDLILDLPNGERWAIEAKYRSSQKLRRGFHIAREDTEPTRSFVVYCGAESYPLARDVTAIGLHELAAELAGLA